MSKSIAILITIFIANLAHAYRVTDKYVIYEQGDTEEIQEFLEFFAVTVGYDVRPFPRNETSKSYYDVIDKAVATLHATYLELYNVTAEEFPLPYVVFSRGNSFNAGRPLDGKVHATNFINLGASQVPDLESIYNVLAHEMAHYFHSHTTLGRRYIKANYSHSHSHARELNAENGFGENIGDSPELREKLENLNRAVSIYAGPGSTVSDLQQIKMSQSDPMFNIITRAYTGVFFFPGEEEPEISRDCVPAFRQLGNLYINGLTISGIEKLDALMPLCSKANLVPRENLLKFMLPAEAITELNTNPSKYTDDESPIISIIANSIIANDSPITALLKVAYSYRLTLKNLVDEIQWDKLQIYTAEDEADITAFKILHKLGIANYQLSFLNILSEEGRAACKTSISDTRIDIDYYGASEFGTHHSVCWRYNRTLRMLETYQAISQGALN